MTTTPRLPITPETRVGDLLSAYPDLEPVLVAQAPAFANLKNPVLRRTVAKIATLAQAARVGGIDARALVRALREAAGQDTGEAATGPAQPSTPGQAPAWYRDDLVVARVDADEMLSRGEHPLGVMSQKAMELKGRAILALDSGFLPAPLIDAFRGRGYEVESFELAPSRYRTCVRRGSAAAEDDQPMQCGGC
jgi:carbamoylphosphate synthase small subunit